MNKKFTSITVFIFIVFIGSVFFSTPTHAAVTRAHISVEALNDFVVEPGKTEIIVNPGESVTKNVTVTSRINRTVHFTLSTEDFVGSTDKQDPVVLLGNQKGPYSLKDLIIPEIDSFTLGLGDKITIPVTVSVPVDAEPRGYYGALIVSSDPRTADGSTGSEAEGKTRIVSRIGSLFLVKINGEGTQSGSLQDFKTIGAKKLFYEKNPDGFEIAFKNTGTVHLVPYGSITIKNIVGRVVQELPVDAYFAMPDSVRYQEIHWSSGFSLGRYTAHLSLYKGYGNENEQATIAFWVLPWKLLLGLFVVIALVVLVIYYFATRFEFRKKK